MKTLRYVRLMTYAVLVAIAVLHRKTVRVIPVGFAQQEDAPGPGLGVDGLTSWRGKDEAWIKKQLGDPMWEHGVKLPVPDVGVFEGLQARLEKEFPQYAGGLRSQIWKKGPRSFQVFLVQSAGSWIVFDALSWQEGVVF